MKHNKISKLQFKDASFSNHKIKIAISGLTGLDDSMVSGDGIVASFREHLREAEVVNQEIIYAGQAQYDNRDQKLICYMADISMKIPERIDVLSKSLIARAAEHEGKVKELRKQGFTNDEIDKICPPISQVDIDLVASQKTELRAESLAIEAFLDDAPEFREELLPQNLLKEHRGYQAFLNGEPEAA